MIRKLHSWSLTWTRDKSAEQSGTSIVSPPSGQLVPQAFSSDFVLIPGLPLLGGKGRGEGERSLRLLHPAPCRVFRIRVHPSSSVVPFLCLRSVVQVSVRDCSRSVRDNSQSFANVRDNSRYFHPPPPQAAQTHTPRSAFRNKFYAAPLPLSTLPHSTSIHERSTFFHAPSPHGPVATPKLRSTPQSEIRNPHSFFLVIPWFTSVALRPSICTLHSQLCIRSAPPPQAISSIQFKI